MILCLTLSPARFDYISSGGGFEEEAIQNKKLLTKGFYQDVQSVYFYTFKFLLDIC